MTNVDEQYAAALERGRRRQNVGSQLAIETQGVNHLRAPDFLIIGAQKAGTTWLYANLIYHPDVWLPPIKELNYFNELFQPSTWERPSRMSAIEEARAYFRSLPKLAMWQERNLDCLDHLSKSIDTQDWYTKIFSYSGLDQICGECSPGYSFLSRAAISYIRRTAAFPKVILVLRDPIDRAWSHMKMEKSVANVSAEDLIKYFDVYVGGSNYPEIIRRWKAGGVETSTLLLNYDDLTRSPLDFLRQICDFLDVQFDPAFFPAASKTVASGLVQDIDRDTYNSLKDWLRPVYDELVLMFPESATWRKRHFE